MTARHDLLGIQGIRCAALGILLAISIHPAVGGTEPPSAYPQSLAAEVIRKLESTMDYGGLQALYEHHRRQDGDSWIHSARGRRMWAILEDFRTTAATAQVEFVKDRPTVTVTVNGRKRVLKNAPTSSDQATREYVADQIADLILREFRDGGLIPFDLPPATQKAVDEKMKQGYEAAKQKNYLSAIRHFEDARALAPKAADIYYNLGLAEAHIHGRELRAIAWLSASLSHAVLAPNAAAVNEQMTELSMRHHRHLAHVIALVESEADRLFRTLGERQGEDLKDGKDILIRDKKSGNLRDAARLWAEIGETAAALKTAGTFRREEYKSSALIDIIRAQAGTGDLVGAQKTIELLGSSGSKSWAQLAIVEAHVKNGNAAAAQATAELIQDAVPKEWARSALGTGKPMVPGRYDGRDACYDWLFTLDDGDRSHDAPLKSAPFLGLAAHLKSQSTSDDPQAVFDALRDTADTLVKAHRCIVGRMLKQQAAQRSM